MFALFFRGVGSWFRTRKDASDYVCKPVAKATGCCVDCGMRAVDLEEGCK